MAWLKLIFGGSFGYAQAAIIGIATIALVWVWQDYKGAKADAERLQAANTVLQETLDSQTQTIASQARSQARRDVSDKSLAKTEDNINALPQTVKCSNSEPVRNVISGLFDKQNANLAGGVE